MKQVLMLTPDHDPRHRSGHGAKFIYMFRTGIQFAIFSCIYDSTAFNSPVSQIIHEHPDFFQNTNDVHLRGGAIIPMKHPDRHEHKLCVLCAN